jgi:hypothetical protein
MYERVVRPIVGRALFFDKRVNVAKRAEIYMPYAWSNLVFDKTKIDAALEGTGVHVAHARTYFAKLLEFQAKAVKAG